MEIEDRFIGSEKIKYRPFEIALSITYQTIQTIFKNLRFYSLKFHPDVAFKLF